MTGAQLIIATVDLDNAALPVPGVLITLDTSGTAVNLQGTTYADGRLLFKPIPTGLCATTASKAGYLADLKPLFGKIVNSGSNSWALSMQKTSSAQINVDLPSGSPAVGATVVLTNTDPMHQTSTTTKTADASGTVLFPNLWEIKNVGYSYGLKITIPNDSSNSVLTTTFPMESGGLNKVFDLVFPIGNWVTTTVFDRGAGWAVQGASVNYIDSLGHSNVTSLTTDVNGQCTFLNITPGITTFKATKSPTRMGTLTKTMVTGSNVATIQTDP